MTLKDVANQLLLPILSDVDPSGMELSPEEEVVEAKLKKGMSGNAKLSHWVRAFSNAKLSHWFSPTLCYKTFIFFIGYKDFC